MKIISTLSKRHKTTSFFFNEDFTHSMCVRFVDFFLGKIPKSDSVNVVLNTKNPKKKGFRKINFHGSYVTMNKKEITLTYSQTNVLLDIGLWDGDSFWLKVEEA